MTDNEIARMNEVAETLRKTYDEGGIIALRHLLIYNWSNVMEYSNNDVAAVCIDTMDVAVWDDGPMYSAIEECVTITLDAELTDAIIRASADIPQSITRYPLMFVEPGTVSKEDMETLCTTWGWFLGCNPGDITAEQYIQWMRENGLMDRSFFELRMDCPEFEPYLEDFGFTDRFEDFLKDEIEHINAKTYARLLPGIRQIADAIRYYWG